MTSAFVSAVMNKFELHVSADAVGPRRVKPYLWGRSQADWTSRQLRLVTSLYFRRSLRGCVSLTRWNSFVQNCEERN